MEQINTHPTSDNLTTSEAARLLRYESEVCFRRAVAREGIPHVRVNARRMLFPRSALEAWMQRRTVGGAQ